MGLLEDNVLISLLPLRDADTITIHYSLDDYAYDSS